MKKLIALLLALVMVFAMVACGNTDAPAAPSEPAAPGADAKDPAPEGFVWNGHKEVWSILPTTNAEGLIWINDTMGAVMQDKGFTYVKKDAEGNPANQVTFVEDAIAAGNVGALMIAAMDVVLLKDVVEQAVDAGIAVAMLGAEPTDYQIAGCVYTAYEITGQFAVEAAEDWVAKRVAEGGNVPANADGKYEVACDIFTDITDGIYRSNAVVGMVDKSASLVRVATNTSYNDGYSKAYNNTQDILGANPDCHIFIAYEPQLALGMADAIAEHCDLNGLDLADYCVISCYGEDTTFSEIYPTIVENHSVSAIKGYSTYGDAPLPFGDPAKAVIGEESYAAVEAHAQSIEALAGMPVMLPPFFTGWHLADILLSACGQDGYTWTYGETYYDTISVTSVYGFEKTWVNGDENPAIEYKVPNFIG